jgi:Fe-S cluster assembly iron-binding protein IscA
MLNLTEPARQKLSDALASGELESGRLRVFIDHRCHCGKAHFSLAHGDEPSDEDTVFEVGGIPFMANAETAPELGSVEIDFMETFWTKGFTISNVDHECGPHMMRR